MTELVAKLKNKDKNAVALLYNRYGKKLYGYSVAHWKIDEDDAWELIYKTLYKVIHAIDNYSFENENKLAGFIFKIFINYLRNHHRDTKNKRIETMELYDIAAPDTEMAEESTNRISPLMECLQKVLQALEDWQRIILLMRAQNYPYEAIAGYVNRPEEQLKVYHMRLKKTVTEKTNTCVENNSK